MKGILTPDFSVKIQVLRILVLGFMYLLPLFLYRGNAQQVIVQPGIQVGNVNDGFLREISGMVMSRSISGSVWLHEDSGAEPVFYGMDKTTGIIHSQIELSAAPAVDWEDMAIAPKPGGGNHLYFGDIGDNGASRNLGIDIIRITEPTLIGNTTIDGNEIKVKRVVYPGIIFLREEDAESLFADPIHGDIFIIQKLNPGRLFMLPADQFENPGTFTLLSLGPINAPLNKPTAADISPDGRFIIVRNSSEGGIIAYLFVRDVEQNQTVASAMSGVPIAVSLQSEPQGEAIAWAPDGSGFYSISEGENSPIWFYAISSNLDVSETGVNNQVEIISPNPAHHDIAIQIPENMRHQKGILSVMDISGRELIRQQIKDDEPAIKLDIGMLPNSVYMIQIQTGRTISNSRFIKQN